MAVSCAPRNSNARTGPGTGRRRHLSAEWALTGVNGGPVGFDPKTFSGPFIDFLAFAQYLLPLALAESYFRAQRAGTLQRWGMAVVLGISALVTAVGIVGAAMGLWLPRL